ncbi:MAG: insulinase family protein [Muribaculaceae bacterium]|nr:insulinase family protein [Muribaculaceae bacterium]
MIRFLSTVCIILFYSLFAAGQDLKVNGCRAAMMGLSASTQMRLDANKMPCALVKVGLRSTGASFEGNIVGEVEFRTNEYWVYMTAGTKMLRIKHISARPLLLRFADYGIESLDSKITYEVDIQLPQSSAAEINQMVLVNLDPPDAKMSIDGKSIAVANGVAQTVLMADRSYSYTVESPGYDSNSGTFYLEPTSPKQFSVNLKRSPAQPPSSYVPTSLVAESNAPDVITGKLDNGLTYYICRRSAELGKASFYLAQKVGCNQENDSQLGATHFIEHMLFNGTRHFPGSSLLSWADAHGIKFGANMNAYTAYDNSLYMLTEVPVTGTSIVDSCLLVLRDWAADLSLHPEAVNAERAVIQEEYRVMPQYTKTQYSLLSELFPGSKYGNRTPIGDMNIVSAISPTELRNYYKSWFRPELQCVVVAGDIEPRAVERKIQAMFADMTNPTDAPAFLPEPVPDNKGTLFAIKQDASLNNSFVNIMFKQDVAPAELNSATSVITEYVLKIVISMLDKRLSDLAKTKPGLKCEANYSNYLSAGTKDALSLTASFNGIDAAKAFELLYSEIAKARKGFTASEYEQAKLAIINSYETASNSYTARELIDCYLKGLPVVDKRESLSLVKQVSEHMKLAVINQVILELLGTDNRAVMMCGPGVMPQQSELTKLIEAIDKK